MELKYKGNHIIQFLMVLFIVDYVQVSSVYTINKKIHFFNKSQAFCSIEDCSKSFSNETMYTEANWKHSKSISEFFDGAEVVANCSRERVSLGTVWFYNQGDSTNSTINLVLGTPGKCIISIANGMKYKDCLVFIFFKPSSTCIEPTGLSTTHSSVSCFAKDIEVKSVERLKSKPTTQILLQPTPSKGPEVTISYNSSLALINQSTISTTVRPPISKSQKLPVVLLISCGVLVIVLVALVATILCYCKKKKKRVGHRGEGTDGEELAALQLQQMDGNDRVLEYAPNHPLERQPQEGQQPVQSYQ